MFLNCLAKGAVGLQRRGIYNSQLFRFDVDGSIELKSELKSEALPRFP